MEFDVWANTDVGLKREINQDSILVDKNLGLFIVADGMGGHKGGEVASALAVETAQEIIRDKLNEKRLMPRKIMADAYREASARIHHKSTHENPELMGMGTTMVGVLGFKNKIFIANVGDSRAYMFKNSQLWQLTEDHSLINEQVKAGAISEEEAPHVMGRNVITRSVGFEKDVTVDTLERVAESGEIYLLCSDGLCGMIEDAHIAKILKETPIDQVVPRCIEEAKKAGGDDNVSVIVIRIK
jgi:protein phosphatase